MRMVTGEATGEPDMAEIGALIERGINGPELPDYAECPDSAR